MINAVITAENKPAYCRLVSKFVAYKGKTYEYEKCVDVLLHVGYPVFIDLANQVINPCPSSAFRFDSYALDLVYFFFRNVLCSV